MFVKQLAYTLRELDIQSHEVHFPRGSIWKHPSVGHMYSIVYIHIQRYVHCCSYIMT